METLPLKSARNHNTVDGLAPLKALLDTMDYTNNHLLDIH